MVSALRRRQQQQQSRRPRPVDSGHHHQAGAHPMSGAANKVSSRTDAYQGPDRRLPGHVHGQPVGGPNGTPLGPARQAPGGLAAGGLHAPLAFDEERFRRERDGARGSEALPAPLLFGGQREALRDTVGAMGRRGRSLGQAGASQMSIASSLNSESLREVVCVYIHTHVHAVV